MIPVFDILQLKIYSYPFIMGIAWGIGYHLLLDTQIAKKINSVLFTLGLFLFSWIGAKLFFLIHSLDNQFVDYAFSSNFWLGGGLVFYGGLIFSVAFTYGFSKFYKIPIDNFYELLPITAFCHAIGRLGCFLAGCCFGKETDISWAVHLHGADRHPVQLYEFLLLVIIGFIVRKKLKDGNALFSYFMLYSFARFTLEFFRGDKIRGDYFGYFSTSQMISLLIMVMIFSVIIKKRLLREFPQA